VLACLPAGNGVQMFVNNIHSLCLRLKAKTTTTTTNITANF